MVQVFEGWIEGRDVAPERAEIMRDAYVRALHELNLLHGPVEIRRSLAEVVLQLAQVETFPDSEQLAELAISWYRSLSDDEISGGLQP